MIPKGVNNAFGCFFQGMNLTDYKNLKNITGKPGYDGEIRTRSRLAGLNAQNNK
jgi:hypothetical protein